MGCSWLYLLSETTKQGTCDNPEEFLQVLMKRITLHECYQQVNANGSQAVPNIAHPSSSRGLGKGRPRRCMFTCLQTKSECRLPVIYCTRHWFASHSSLEQTRLYSQGTQWRYHNTWLKQGGRGIFVYLYLQKEWNNRFECTPGCREPDSS